ncbi:deoxynucleotide monophosphate kinase family protein [Marinobacter salarius]|uniref:Dephospho-CoA kinase n=1 Tax=Marinobacter salarius TaxID=1420917 RepID=A0A1W6K984_9GAMM|nr:hypothetical protein [Marinobacter salarius]ARM83971.1 hypothetical protein MARSALSMR5_01893 [Marinobacter salarius]
MRLIGVTGKARSGKDTVAKALIERFGLVKYSFADPMKEGVKVMFGLSEDHVNGDLKEQVIPSIGVSPRRILQTLGTEWGRDIIRNDLWVVLAQKKWEAVKQATDETFHGGMIVPDVRFEDEAEFIRSNGGTLIHIERDAAQEIEGHISEAGVKWQKGDARVKNNGTLTDLKRWVTWAMK